MTPQRGRLFAQAVRQRDHLTTSAVLCRVLSGFKGTQLTTHGVFPVGSTHQTFPRSCGVHFRCSLACSSTVPCALSAQLLVGSLCFWLAVTADPSCRRSALSDQKFELVHQSSATVLTQRCCELKLGRDTSGTAIMNTQKLLQVVRMSRDVAVHVNVSFT